MLNLEEVIEDNNGPELDIFEREIAKLTTEQLERLVVEEGVYEQDLALGTDRDFLEIGAAEVSWRVFFAAWRLVTGSGFPLDGS